MGQLTKKAKKKLKKAKKKALHAVKKVAAVGKGAEKMAGKFAKKAAQTVVHVSRHPKHAIGEAISAVAMYYGGPLASAVVRGVYGKLVLKEKWGKAALNGAFTYALGSTSSMSQRFAVRTAKSLMDGKRLGTAVWSNLASEMSAGVVKELDAPSYLIPTLSQGATAALTGHSVAEALALAGTQGLVNAGALEASKMCVGAKSEPNERAFRLPKPISAARLLTAITKPVAAAARVATMPFGVMLDGLQGYCPMKSAASFLADRARNSVVVVGTQEGEGLVHEALPFIWGIGATVGQLMGRFDHVVVAKSKEQVFRELARIARETGSIGELEIWAHGSPGQVCLGGEPLNAHNLHRVSSHAMAGGSLFQPQASIYFRSCSTLSGGDGEKFASTIQSVFHVAVVAGHDRTIHVAHAGMRHLTSAGFRDAPARSFLDLRPLVASPDGILPQPEAWSYAGNKKKLPSPSVSGTRLPTMLPRQAYGPTNETQLGGRFFPRGAPESKGSRFFPK